MGNAKITQRKGETMRTASGTVAKVEANEDGWGVNEYYNGEATYSYGTWDTHAEATAWMHKHLRAA